MEQQKILQLLTQSHLIAHRVCWSVSRKFLCSLAEWEPNFYFMTHRERFDSTVFRQHIHIVPYCKVLVYFPLAWSNFFTSYLLLLLQMLLFCLINLLCPALYALAAQVLLQTNNKICNCDCNLEWERQSAAGISSYLFISTQTQRVVLNHLTSRLQTSCLSLSLSAPHSKILINCFVLGSLLKQIFCGLIICIILTATKA